MAGACSLLATMAIAATPAAAVNADQGTQVVARDSGRLHAAGDERLGQRASPRSATRSSPRARSPRSGRPLTERQHHAQPDLRLRRDHGRHRHDLQPQPRTARVNSLDTDGTSIYVGGSFTTVERNIATKRVAKLTAAGAWLSGSSKAPNSGGQRGRRRAATGSTSAARSPRSAATATRVPRWQR